MMRYAALSCKAVFSKWLKEQRVASGMTQQELADQMLTSRATVCQWENPQISNMPNSTRMLILMDAFRFEVEADHATTA